MHGPENDGTLSTIPAAQGQPTSRWSFQVVWLIPLVSALIGGWLAVKAVLERGPTITVSFQNAEGLEAGKTKLKYKDVEIGLVKSVTLAKDLTRVIATAELVKDFTPHLVEDTRFWIVRPRISGGTVSGLNTLLSGSYVAVDIGKAAASRREFQGLDTPPIVFVDAPGREFVLTSDSVGSVDSGSPVFFRRLKVGQVTSYALNEDGSGVTIKVSVNAPYDKYVRANTRFWSARGFDVTIDANGLKLELESFVSLLLGGIAFERFYTRTDGVGRGGDMLPSLDYAAVVGPVFVPDVVDRPQFVLRMAGSEVKIADQARWAEPLRQPIGRVIAVNIAHGLNNARVSSQTQGSTGEADFRVVIDVQRFDSAPGETATIAVTWTVRHLSGEHETARVRMEEPVTGADYDALVAAHTRAIARLSGDIVNPFAPRGSRVSPWFPRARGRCR